VNGSDKNKRLIGLAALLLAVALIAAALFYACYRYDNKYTAPGPQSMGGILMLDNEALARNPILYLVRDWEIYRDRLLAPADFMENAPPPDELVFIGQYGGFEGSTEDFPERSPHGSATYRLNIFLPPETRSYMLELPEIYSAYKLYINGAHMAQMGETEKEHYRPQTGNRSVTVQAAGRIEILIAVSDYSYIYSGMVYPPAFGDPEAVAGLLNNRLALRAAVNAAALCIGLLYLCLWLLTRKEHGISVGNPSPLYYAALCACFVMYTCYPVIKTVLPVGMGWYTVENVAYCLMPLLVALIQRPLTALPAKWLRPFVILAVFACCWAIVVPLVMGENLTLMMAYSWLIEIGAWAFALYLTAGAVYGVIRGAAHSEVMLAGITVFDAALIMDKLFPMFEPMRLGWFNEIAGGILVLVTGYVMAMGVARQFRLRQALENQAERVSKMLEVQRAQYPVLLEKEKEVVAARHDLHHHISMIRQLYSESGDKLAEYLNTLDDRQIEPEWQAAYCKHPIVNTLLGMYDGLARGQETDFHVRAVLPETLPINDADLCVILSNLLENALEAVKRLPPVERSVSVSIGCEFQLLGVFIDNPFTGELSAKNGRFLSSKQLGREGIGLASVNAICKSYGGGVRFHTDENGVFHSEVTLPLPSAGKPNSGEEM
jgi:hypothetical protein